MRHDLSGYEKERLVKPHGDAAGPHGETSLALVDARTEETEARWEQRFEYTEFVFDFPAMDETTHPDLGVIRVDVYEPLAMEVCGRPRRSIPKHTTTSQPRQGKKFLATSRPARPRGAS